MKVLVTYYSDTGNTEKLARSIYEAIPDDKEIKRVQDTKGSAGYDLVFCGFPVHAHSVPNAAAQFIKELPEGQSVAFFSTHGSLRGGHLPRQAFEHALSLAVKARVLGHFGCRGQVSEKVIDNLMKKPEHHAWAQEALGASGHPDINDLEDGMRFAVNIIKKLEEERTA